ncbi:hypothetical protein RHS04_04691 [Rhizoctonia solani]|uniref:Ubiquitin-like domain-containing protein n=1 Tax=Rhizoctonia solani TaxID=456999 RepID=A0A8H7HB76_9AGAM|nr:hypothetical protein RHS04_04691 [Rhizoctonia solani]
MEGYRAGQHPCTRKKCDEVRPICGRCRGRDDCIWPASRLTQKCTSRPTRLLRIQPRPDLELANITVVPSETPDLNPVSEGSITTFNLYLHDLGMESLRSLPEPAIEASSHDLSIHHFSPTMPNTLDMLSQFGGSLSISTDAFQSQGNPTVPKFINSQYIDTLAFVCVKEDGPAYIFDEDEEEALKPSEWLPGALRLINLYLPLDLPLQHRVLWSNVLDSYFTFLVRYSYDPSNLPSHVASFVTHYHQVESIRLGTLGSSLLFYSFLNAGASQSSLREHAYEMIDAAITVLQAEMTQSTTTLDAQLAGISELLSFYYYAGDLGGYIKYMERAAPVVRQLVGAAPISIHKLYGFKTLDIRIFAWCDVCTAMTTSRPTHLLYDCNADALLSRNQNGPDPSSFDNGLEWLTGLPDAFSLLTIQILNLKHKQISSTELIARAATIEAALRAWKIWPTSTTNSMMKIQRISAQEIWRHSIILYLYQVIYKAAPNQEIVQQSVKQIIKLASTLRPGHNPDCLLYVPYFIAGTFAISAKDRQFIRNRLMACTFSTYMKILLGALEELWQQTFIDKHTDWTSRSPPLVIDKAKGKQRATNDENTEPEQRRPITIRFTEREPDLLLGVSPRDTVRDVKALIRSLRPSLERRRLRLVHAGRLLTDGTRLVPWLEALESHSRKSNANNTPVRSPVASPTSGNFPSRKSVSSIQEQDPEPADVWIHCSIGTEGDDIDGDDKQQEPQIAPMRGFDRLASAGFSAEDIESMRRQFHAQRPEVLDQDDEHARALEEQWVDNMDSGLPGAESNDGADVPPIFSWHPDRLFLSINTDVLPTGTPTACFLF